MPTVSLPQGQVHFQEFNAGNQAGPPLLLLHANPGDSRDFAAIMPVLAAHYRVLALDWPGYGASPLPTTPGAVDGDYFYQVLAALIDALGLDSVILLGNSVGGACAARYAAEYPHRVAALLLVAPGGFTPHNLMTKAFCRLQGSRLALSPQCWASLYVKVKNDHTRAMLNRAAGEQSNPERLALNRAVWRGFVTPNADIRRAAGNITAPTLMMFGAHDPAIPAGKDGREAQRAIPHAETAILPCGHAAFAEMPAEFLAKVMPFLQQVGTL